MPSHLQNSDWRSWKTQNKKEIKKELVVALEVSNIFGRNFADGVFFCQRILPRFFLVVDFLLNLLPSNFKSRWGLLHRFMHFTFFSA